MQLKARTTDQAVIRLQTSWILSIIFSLIAASCTSAESDDLIDRSFITKKPCAPPCWYGLELDHSGRDEVYATLKQLPFIDQSSIKESEGYEYLGDTNAVEISWGCSHPIDKSCGGAILAHGKLILIWHSIGYDLSFKAVVDPLGPPAYIDYHPYHPDVGGCQIVLNWPDQGIGVDYLDTKHEKLCLAIEQGNGIPPNTPVRTVYYMVKELTSSEPGEYGFHQPWPGFSEP